MECDTGGFALWWPNLGRISFWWPDISAPSTSTPAGTEEQQKTEHIVDGTGQIPSALIDGKWQHRQLTRVEQGVYENGIFKLLRSQNGDATDYGLRFGEETTVLRVTLGTY